MLLNCLSQPTLLTDSKPYLGFAEFKKAPLLICHKNALDGKLLPKGWSGKMFATQEVLHGVEQNEYTRKAASTHPLCPSEAYNINMCHDEEYPYCSKTVEITAIPWNNEYIMYLIRDENVVNLLTDMISEDMSVFLRNKTLRNAVKSGIDVLYINDGVYHKSKELKIYPSEYLLGALVTLVQPRFIKGLLDERLPHYIADCCVNVCNE